MVNAATQELRRVFSDLVKQWRLDAKPTSLMADRAMHPAYLRIIGLGRAALPLILQELQEHGEPWFWALEAISGENPIAEADYGRVSRMIAAWTEWGHRNGYTT